MLKLHFGRLGVCLIGVETVSVLPQNHLDAISDCSRFRTAQRRQAVEGERTIVATGVVENVDTIEVEDVERLTSMRGRVLDDSAARPDAQRALPPEPAARQGEDRKGEAGRK